MVKFDVDNKRLRESNQKKMAGDSTEQVQKRRAEQNEPIRTPQRSIGGKPMRPRLTPMAETPRGALLIVVVLIVVMMSRAVSGCASGRSGSAAMPAVEQSAEESRMRVRADWNDVEAAVWVGSEWAETAVRRIERLSESEYRFDLKTIRDKTATLRVARLDAGVSTTHGEHENAALQITCRVVPMRDQEHERRIIEGVARRLEQLRGVEFAPVK